MKEQHDYDRIFVKCLARRDMPYIAPRNQGA
jgi:hypothetical protein